jgi:hypothetical protein
VKAEEFVGDNEYQIAKWFKVTTSVALRKYLLRIVRIYQLHLHPDHMKLSKSDLPLADGSQTQSNTNGGINAMEIPPLLTGVPLKKLYTDFLAYLRANTREFFENSTPNGAAIWTRLAMNGRLFVILATPNGWDSSQQAFLRAAATDSGWIHDSDTKKNQDDTFTFVTESEASVHYALAHQNSSWLDKGTQFIVIDAGGSTVDSTLYECKEKTPKLVLQEVCASECVQVSLRYEMRIYSTFISI